MGQAAVVEATGAADAVQEFASVLNGSGLHAALAFLNGRTRHRYTGVYRFDPPLLRNVCLFDRENPPLALGGDVPMAETYCSLVGERAALFGTPNAARDERLVGHPARDVVRAYCGVPLRGGDGRCIGTLCHYDLRPRLTPDREIPLMERAAALIAARL
jgi:hypothetical protein